jgi:MerR family mercuric resistance operon transcriptional regulator
MNENVFLSIGQVAKDAEVNVETVRYYQRRGLLAEPPKPVGGHRRYSSQVVKRLRFIKRAQVLGFTLEEIENLLRLDGANTCADTRSLAAHKLDVIEAKIADLAAMQSVLAGLVQQCEIGEKRGECPIINALLRSDIVVPRKKPNASQGTQVVCE